MRRAAKSVYDRARESAGVGSVTVLVDGLPVYGFECPSRNLVKGDAKSLLIAAASILAKTARDADCLRLEAEYPGYGFAKHKGYPTKAHLAALAKLGPCPEHRRSFGPVAQGELFDFPQG
jgi:ribonuclease HII